MCVCYVSLRESKVYSTDQLSKIEGERLRVFVQLLSGGTIASILDEGTFEREEDIRDTKIQRKELKKQHYQQQWPRRYCIVRVLVGVIQEFCFHANQLGLGSSDR